MSQEKRLWYAASPRGTKTNKIHAASDGPSISHGWDRARGFSVPSLPALWVETLTQLSDAADVRLGVVWRSGHGRPHGRSLSNEVLAAPTRDTHDINGGGDGRLRLRGRCDRGHVTPAR